jgi:hypothetical protein
MAAGGGALILLFDTRGSEETYKHNLAVIPRRVGKKPDPLGTSREGPNETVLG